MRLKDKVAVVTGGASGIGFASVMRFLEEGAKVVITDYNVVTGKTALAHAEEAGYEGSVLFVQADVAVEGDVENMLQFAVNEFGALDIVFNNAGVGGAFGPLTEITTSDWDYTFDVLAKGVFLGTKHAARIMKARGLGGCIINTASIAALSGDAGALVYSAAKSAVLSLTKSSAVELAIDRIRVNAICPGCIVTPLSDGGNQEETKALFSKSQPWPNYGRGEDIAGAAVFLASDDAAFVTGESLTVDGGITAAGPEFSIKYPHIAGRNSKLSGITKGSTGVESELRKRDGSLS